MGEYERILLPDLFVLWSSEFQNYKLSNFHLMRARFVGYFFEQRVLEKLINENPVT